MSEREIQQMAGERRLEKLNNFSDVIDYISDTNNSKLTRYLENILETNLKILENQTQKSDVILIPAADIAEFKRIFSVFEDDDLTSDFIREISKLNGWLEKNQGCIINKPEFIDNILRLVFDGDLVEINNSERNTSIEEKLKNLVTNIYVLPKIKVSVNNIFKLYENNGIDKKYLNSISPYGDKEVSAKKSSFKGILKTIKLVPEAIENILGK